MDNNLLRLKPTSFFTWADRPMLPSMKRSIWPAVTAIEASPGWPTRCCAALPRPGAICPGPIRPAGPWKTWFCGAATRPGWWRGGSAVSVWRRPAPSARRTISPLRWRCVPTGCAQNLALKRHRRGALWSSLLPELCWRSRRGALRSGEFPGGALHGAGGSIGAAPAAARRGIVDLCNAPGEGTHLAELWAAAG